MVVLLPVEEWRYDRLQASINPFGSVGGAILFSALTAPERQIWKNAGITYETSSQFEPKYGQRHQNRETCRYV